MKKPWLSKTLWLSAIGAASALVPQVSDWIAANPETYSMAISAAFFGLRLVTKGELSIK